MLAKANLSLFSPKNECSDNVEHIVIPTSVEHHYEHLKFGTATRNKIYIKKYSSPLNEQEQNPIVFFHGGPGIVNEEQYSITQQYFTNRGHAFYIPEVEGSAMYSRGALPQGFDPSTMCSTDSKLLEITKWGESGLNEFTQNYVDDIKDVLVNITKEHPGKKINVITHSLGGHQVLRTLQQAPELNTKIEGICDIAGVSNIGASRFWFTVNKTLMAKGDAKLFYELLNEQDIRFFKSKANENQDGLVIDKNNNPSVNQQLNERFSVIHNDLAHLPPILFLHALDDQAVTLQSSVLLQQKIQENNGLAYGFYFPKGGHQFIKNEGDPEIRNIALKKIHDFFQQPTKDLSNDLSQLTYEDVMSEFSQFIQDQETYLNNKLSAEITEKISYRMSL